MKKNGFTLIELLAVIVLLGILSVIVVPVISKSIDDSKKEAFISSVNGIYDAVNHELVLSKIPLSSEYEFSGKTLTKLSENGDLLETPEIIKINGKIESGEGSVLTNENGDILVTVTNGEWCAFNMWNDSSIEVREGNCNFLTDNSWAKSSCLVFEDELGKITDYDISCGPSVVIPMHIDRYSVKYLDDNSFVSGYYNPSSVTKNAKNIEFASVDLLVVGVTYPISSVDFSDSIYLEEIGLEAFAGNNISSLNLSGLKNLKTIGYSAFADNNINYLDFTNCVNLKFIEDFAFANNPVIMDNITGLSNDVIVGEGNFEGIIQK